MGVVSFTTVRRTVAGNLRLVIGTATLASGTSNIDTGLKNILFADATPDSDAAQTGQTVDLKLNTAEGTEGDARGFLTIESADNISYCIFAWGT